MIETLISEGILKLNTIFIGMHIDELVQVEDYVPISFSEYDMQSERDDFLKSKNLLSIIQDMKQLINQKCQAYEDSVKALNSVIIEWIDCHPEFEGIISEDSFDVYQSMKNNEEYIDFNDLLDFMELSSEKKQWAPPKPNDDYSIKDDSNIQLPNFKEVDDIFDEYSATLLACYLSYLIK